MHSFIHVHRLQVDNNNSHLNPRLYIVYYSFFLSSLYFHNIYIKSMIIHFYSFIHHSVNIFCACVCARVELQIKKLVCGTFCWVDNDHRLKLTLNDWMRLKAQYPCFQSNAQSLPCESFSIVLKFPLFIIILKVFEVSTKELPTIPFSNHYQSTRSEIYVSQFIELL